MSQPWSPDLTLGHPAIDEQHLRIFRILGALQEAMEQGREHEEVGRTLSAVAVFVGAHFRMEEDLMRRSGFPGLAPHQAKHRAVQAEVEAMVDQFHRDGLAPLDLARFMADWVHGHVQREDRPLADFLASHPPGPGPGAG